MAKHFFVLFYSIVIICHILYLFYRRWIPNCGPRLIRQGLTIFTEFGDLNATQMLRLFQLFTSWPEFPDCPFQASMETSFLKNDPAIELEKETEAETEEVEESEHEPPPV